MSRLQNPICAYTNEKIELRVCVHMCLYMRTECKIVQYNSTIRSDRLYCSRRVGPNTWHLRCVPSSIIIWSTHRKCWRVCVRSTLLFSFIKVGKVFWIEKSYVNRRFKFFFSSFCLIIKQGGIIPLEYFPNHWIYTNWMEQMQQFSIQPHFNQFITLIADIFQFKKKQKTTKLGLPW